MSKSVPVDNDKGSTYYSAHARDKNFCVTKKVLLLFFLNVFCIECLSTFADTVTTDSGGFPGKGNYQDWKRACSLYNDGMALYAANNFDEAIKRYSQAVEVYPYDPDFYNNLGLAYKKKSLWSKAEFALRNSVKLRPSWEGFANLGHVLKKEGRSLESKGALEQAIRLNPPIEVKAKLNKEIGELASGSALPVVRGN